VLPIFLSDQSTRTRFSLRSPISTLGHVGFRSHRPLILSNRSHGKEEAKSLVRSVAYSGAIQPRQWTFATLSVRDYGPRTTPAADGECELTRRIE
jgi:hypothetical protein